MTDLAERRSRGRLLVVANRHASRARQSLGEALGYLADQGFDLDVRCPADSEAACAVIEREGPSADVVVVAGGDGTIGGALPALLAIDCTTGILPFGTANDLALTLDIPAEPQAAAVVIAGGHRRRIDVGRVNQAFFVNVASIGLSVKVAEHQTAEAKRQWGVLSYAVTALQALGTAEKFHATITCDDRREDVFAYQIAVGNGVHYGGGLTVAAEAAIDDGLLDAYAIETDSLADLVAVAPLLPSGNVGSNKDVRIYRGRRITVDTERPMPINTDGEVKVATPATFSVARSALEILVPAP